MFGTYQEGGGGMGECDPSPDGLAGFGNTQGFELIWVVTPESLQMSHSMSLVW